MRFVIIFLLFVSCHSSKNNTVDSDFKQVVIAHLGEDVKYDYNKNEELVLCKKTTNGIGGINFLVYNLKEESIVYQEKILRGSVKWKTDSLVEVFVGLGNRTPEYPEGYYTYTIDVTTGKKVKKN